MDPALELRAAPAARARIGAFRRNRGARLAADASVSGIVKREIIDFILRGVFPDLAPSPSGERTRFQEHFARGQLVVLQHF